MGFAKDDQASANWLRRSAEQGDAEGQYFLGNRYAEGKGVPQSDYDAYVWFSVAAANGNGEAERNRDYAMSQLTPEQVKEGRELAGEYFGKYQPKQ